MVSTSKFHDVSCEGEAKLWKLQQTALAGVPDESRKAAADRKDLFRADILGGCCLRRSVWWASGRARRRSPAGDHQPAETVRSYFGFEKSCFAMLLRSDF